MEGRIVASFRAVGGPGRAFLERTRSLIARVNALGGVHVGWDVLKLTFAFESTAFPSILELATTPGEDTQGEEPLWAVGVAQGDLRVVNEPGSLLTASGLLWWGPPMVAASALAGLARPGEILCAQTVPALRAGELVTSGLRIARDGTLRVRGARIDRRQPWRKTAAENLTRMIEPRLVTAHLPVVKLEPGALVVVRADPGAGGTRFLRELAAHAPKALLVSPSGSGFEPLGALRRALRRSIGGVINPLLLELSGPLEALLAGKGVNLETAAKLITAFLWPKQSGSNSALIIDDAKAVDPATLEACVRAVRNAPALGLVARLDASSGLPSVLATLPKAAEHEIPMLSREGAEDVAVGCTAGALDALARRRWARLGGGNPLAIVEAITDGIASGDLTWMGALEAERSGASRGLGMEPPRDRASPRSRAAGRGKVRPAAKWIRQRANAENTPARAVLSLLAVIGGEASVGFLVRVFEKAGFQLNVPGTVAQLQKSRWLVVTQEAGGAGDGSNEAYFGFPSRTHHKALFNTLEDDARKKLHLAIARVIDEEDGPFGRVEGAWHAAQGGEGKRAAAVFLDGARATADARLEASTTQLIAFARRADPSCEEAALELLSNALERAPSMAPPAVSIPPPATTPSAPPLPPVSSRPGVRSVPPVPPSSARGSIPASRGPSMAPPARSGPARIAAIASVPPSRHKASVPAPPAPTHAAIPPPPDPSADEPDSMIEHARIVPPEEPDSMVERAIHVPADKRHSQNPVASDSEPPTMADAELAPMADMQAQHGFELDPAFALEPPIQHVSNVPSEGSGSPSSAPGSQIAVRLGELAKEALLTADNAALERWVDGLRATGESPAFTERMRAMARLGRGDIGDALRVLRRTRAQLDPQDHRRRCQTSLALGVALSVAGRPQEALLEAMDALARARQTADERGAKACLAFLARLYTSVSRDAEAELLRAHSI